MRSAPLLLALLTLSCSGSDAQRAQIASNAQTISVCCDPSEATPTKVGEFLIQIYEGELSFLDPETITAVFTSVISGGAEPMPQQHTPISPVTLSLPSGSEIPLGSTAVEVLVEDCHFSRVNVRFLAEVIGRRLDNQELVVLGIDRAFDVINTCPPAGPAPSPPERIVETILGEPISGFEAFAQTTPVGVPTCNANPMIPAQVPPEAYTETFEVGAVVVELDQEQLDDAFTGSEPSFPPGSGPNGLTVLASSPLPMTPGAYLIAWQCVEEEIPLASMQKFLQYAFVADRDADSANNFRAMPPLEKDPFDDTDTWYSTQYDRFVGWRVTTVDAQVFPPQPFSSAVRVIIQGQVLLSVIPVDELDSPPQILTRYTALSHEGDQGLSGGPWSADATPPVGEPRIPVTMTVSY